MKATNNGFLHLFINLVMLVAIVPLTMLIVRWNEGVGILFCIVACILYVLHLIGFMIIQPNMARVLIFFGKYRGTVTDNGFFWVNPFYSARRMSLRARNMDVAPIKVNDKNGNPIMIGLVLVWKIKDTYKACFDIEVDNTTTVDKEGNKTTKSNGYDNFVNVQSDAALRKVAGMYAYDNIDHHSEELTLRSGGEEINDRLEKELRRYRSGGSPHQLSGLRRRDCQRDAAPSAGRRHHLRPREDCGGCCEYGRLGPEETLRRRHRGAGRRAQGRNGEQPAGGALRRRERKPGD